MITERYLDDVESAFECVQSVSCGMFEYRGFLDEEALLEAWRQLCIHYPIIRSSVYDMGRFKYLLKFSELNYPELTIIADKNGEQFQNHVQQFQVRDRKQLANSLRQVNRPPSPVAHLQVFRKESGGYVSFSIRHAFVDGVTLGSLQRELWSNYTKIINGSTVQAEPGVSLPASPIETIRERWKNSDHNSSNLPLEKLVSKLTAEHDQEDESRAGGRWRIEFSCADTDRLVNAARERRVSVGGLLVGATALALRDHESPSQSTKVNIKSLVNLRKHLCPPVSDNHIAFLTGSKLVSVGVNVDSSPEAIGVEFKENIDLAINDRDLEITSYSEDSMSGNVDVSFNNIGVLSTDIFPNDLGVVDFIFPRYSYPSNSLRVGIEPRLMVQSYTFKGKLSLIITGWIELERVSENMETWLRYVMK